MIAVLIVGAMLVCPDMEDCKRPYDDLGWKQAGYLWSDQREVPPELKDDTIAGYLWSD